MSDLTGGRALTLKQRQERVRQLIELWPTVSEFAADVGLDRTTPYNWMRRGAIPMLRGSAIIRAARGRGIGVTWEQLAQIQGGSDA